MILTVKAGEAFHPCLYYSTYDRSLLAPWFLCMAKSFSSRIHVERNPIAIHCALLNMGSIWRKGKQVTKQYLNGYAIMKIYFQISFEFMWYTSSAFTVDN